MKLNGGSKGNTAICKLKFGNKSFLMTKTFSKKGVERSRVPSRLSPLTSYNTKFKTFLFNSHLSVKGHNPIWRPHWSSITSGHLAMPFLCHLWNYPVSVAFQGSGITVMMMLVMTWTTSRYIGPTHTKHRARCHVEKNQPIPINSPQKCKDTFHVPHLRMRNGVWGDWIQA